MAGPSTNLGTSSNPSDAPKRHAAAATELFDQQRGGGRGMGVRAMLPSLLINAVAPFVAYQVLSSQGMDITQALTISAVFPLISTIWGFVHSRRADIIGVVSLAFIVIGVATSLISGDPRFILIKESFLTAVFGLACLVSLFLARPLMFYFGRQFAGGGDPARTAAFEDLWQYESFRTVNRTMTLVWGVAYLVEAAVRVALSFVLPIPLFLVLSPMLAIGVTIALVAWTMRYARSSARRGAQRMAAMSSGKAGT